jgi:hypothetical protein
MYNKTIAPRLYDLALNSFEFNPTTRDQAMRVRTTKVYDSEGYLVGSNEQEVAETMFYTGQEWPDDKELVFK